MCFFRQKTAYEVRICDWSSYWCSSDLFLPGKGAKVQHRFRESPWRFDEKPLDAAGMSKDKSAKIPTPQPVRGTQDMLGDFADRFAHVVETFERVRRLYGFKRIEVPVIEPTAVFAGSLCETTDVVSTELY